VSIHIGYILHIWRHSARNLLYIWNSRKGYIWSYYSTLQL